MHALSVLDCFIPVEDLRVAKVTHLDFELETCWISVERSQTDAGNLHAAVGIEEEVEAVRVERSWCYYLLIWLPEVSLQKMFKVLEVANLTSDLKTFAVGRSAIIKALYGLIGVVHSIVEQ